MTSSSGLADLRLLLALLATQAFPAVPPARSSSQGRILVPLRVSGSAATFELALTRFAYALKSYLP